MLSASVSPGSSVTKPKKQIACQRCHLRKVKCSGGQPCKNCSLLEDSRCVYPSRDRQVKVSQSFIDQLIQENQDLRERRSSSGARHNSDPPSQQEAQKYDGSGADDSSRNPLLAENPWFFSIEPLDMPIHIGEAADAAFSTRFRQALSGASQRHIPRTDYASDKLLASLAEKTPAWPSPARARFLVKVALQTVCQCYHIVRKSTLLKGLEVTLKNPLASERPFLGKIWALFAIGEVYSAKTKPAEGCYPGLHYFLEANKRLRELSERPGIDTIELRLLVALYASCLNRRHSAYFFAGSAVRLGIVMGLHLNVPEFPHEDQAAREHRKRLWWTAYIFDRIWAAKMGQVLAVQDDDIEIDYPSNYGLPEASACDFGDAEYLITYIRLARLAGDVNTSIYSRKAQKGSFYQRVQKALKDLTGWVEGLPSHLHIDSPPSPLVSPMVRVALHLSFNQCLIIATRPILLHVFRAYREAQTKSADVPNPQSNGTAWALAEACIRCARHSYRLLSEAWINGSFSIFDYFYTQYLFSASTILAISSLMNGKCSKHDYDDWEASSEFLTELRQNGNFAALEFCRHVEAMKSLMQTISNFSSENNDQITDPGAVMMPSVLGLDAPVTPHGASLVTAGMALAEPSLQDFLSQPNFDLQFLGTSSAWTDELQGFYLPNLHADGWTSH